MINLSETDEWDVDEEFSDSSKPNSVYDSSLIAQTKNSLVLSKGSPRKGFNVQDLPVGNSFCAEDKKRNTSFKSLQHKRDSIDFSIHARFRTNKKVPRQWSVSNNRKSSTEILVGLQNKLKDSKFFNEPEKKFDFSPKKYVFSPEKFIIVE